ncbi:tRNA guanosine(34) transglycosylase Tgt [Blattabacterium cuenoti]|uniref:tRNA guanosine(34) transglycosylase Tgt n=1 Tax=Blattabacterium cuenoti TaxID=1653831 RepID=UPI00163C514B|nr:tRNA guanosine(34) transglycosylase Tgt [Blattabacterium cuenoti]
MKFNLIKKDKFTKSRVGILITDHASMVTPIFMPVATKGAIQCVSKHELENIGYQMILGNAYHLYFYPGLEVLYKIQGLHTFMNWHQSILTDSGGYQIFSMKKLNEITEDGVKFRSIFNGSIHFFYPEKSMKIQRIIGGDLIMAFDDCPPYPCSYIEAKKSLIRTHIWLKRCDNYLNNNPEIYNHKQSFFPIIHGSVYSDLRQFSVETVSLLKEYDGYAIGGLSLGEPQEKTQYITNLITDQLPENKPRYLMGVGNPANILEAISLGIDMFDCVIPTRNGRHGLLFTWQGILNIKNSKWKKDFSCLDEFGSSYVDKIYSKSYVRHLFSSKENLAQQIATIHNLAFYFNLMKTAREKILNNTFLHWKQSIIPRLMHRL